MQFINRQLRFAMTCGTLALSVGVCSVSARPANAAIAQNNHEIVLSSQRWRIGFSTRNGSITRVEESGKSGSIWRSGEHGLWRVRFRDNSEIAASAFATNTPARRFSFAADSPHNALTLRYQSADIGVAVRVLARAGGAQLSATIAPVKKTALDFYLPARMRFAPEGVRRFVFPMNGNHGIGIAFKKSFFAPQSGENPLAWQSRTAGPSNYQRLYGGPLSQLADNAPPVALSLTQSGREWLSADLVKRIDGQKANVNRAPGTGQADLTLVDSPNGAYFSASHLGGNGWLWRIGGFVDKEKIITVAMISEVVERVAKTRADVKRLQIGLLDLPNGPDAGAGSAASVSQWRESLKALPSVRDGLVRFVSLANLAALQKALRGGDFVAIINPYGEQLPTRQGEIGATVDAVRDYVRGGGNWFEVGGFPFYSELVAARYLDYFLPYPAAFADFVHLDSKNGSAAIYGVQPPSARPWAGATARNSLFVPGKLQCGGDPKGGYSERAFGTWVEAGKSWRAPRVFVGIGGTASHRLIDYCAQNSIRHGLGEKMSPQKLERFKNALLIYYGGNAREKIAGLPFVPPGALLHFADYLHGGFDKQYPDLLPPNAAFGTAREMEDFFHRARAMGHLVMPYTNTTWWCDHPRGPTFEREGEAPLLKLPDGRLSHERYADNDGYTVSPWHRAVRAATRRVVTQFSTDYPVDVLFQDQVGARGWIMSDWLYDMNPASPTPYAYLDGMLSQGREDAARLPLSTEGGWDKVVNFESQLCGLSFGIMPSAGYAAPFFWSQFPADTEMFPLAQIIAHDKAAMIHHDLGQFVTDRETLSWTLGLGFNMSANLPAASFKQDASREWILWLDRVQKSVCSRYTGQPLQSWSHTRPLVGHGTIRAKYGDVEVLANLDAKPLRDGARTLSPNGFRATAPGLIAASTRVTSHSETRDTMFIAQKRGARNDLWIYGAQTSEAIIEVPTNGTPPKTLDLGGQKVAMQRLAGANANGKMFLVRLPRVIQKNSITPPAPRLTTSPRLWHAHWNAK